jgi:CubicO group peptidase (beta-lactamase class C family)
MEQTVKLQAHMAGSRWEPILPAMRRLIDSSNYPGFGLLVYRHGEVVYEEVAGSRDVAAGLPWEKDTLFRMYSQTKPVTCTALMMLFEEGKFLLEDPVARYIPAFGHVKVFGGMTMEGKMRLLDPERPMTVRHLLTHTAGLSYGFDPSSPVDRCYQQAELIDGVTYGKMPLEPMMEKLAGLPLVNHPGAVYNYSMAHDVVGYLVSVLADMPFDEFLQERIFTPLGMEDTGFWVPPEKAGRMAALYATGEDGKTALACAPYDSHLLKPLVAALGGMGLVSTQRDYLRFGRMLLNGGVLDGARILGRKTLDLMRTNQLNPAQMAAMGNAQYPNWGFGYGLGMGVMVDRGLNGAMRSDGSFGWGGAAGTEMIIDPQEDMVILVATQRLMAPYNHSVLLQNLVYQALN